MFALSSKNSWICFVSNSFFLNNSLLVRELFNLPSLLTIINLVSASIKFENKLLIFKGNLFLKLSGTLILVISYQPCSRCFMCAGCGNPSLLWFNSKWILCHEIPT